jgi:type IX secretion system PorP/SprF family membrane protein
MKKTISILLLLFSMNLAFGQQDALFSQYMFNPFSINPAYAGSRSSISLVALHRSQWLGLNGAPHTQTFSIHSKIRETGLAIGGNLAHDVIGPSRNLYGAITGAYHLKMKVGYLSFALRAGVFNAILNQDLVTFHNQIDQFNTGGKQSAMVPSFDFGAYYYSNRFFAGLSVNHLTKHEFNFSSFPTDATIFLKRHYMLNTGAVFTAGKNILLKPSILLRYSEGSPMSADLNISMLYKSFWWIGASLRNINSIVLLTEFNITDYLRAGYAFDLSLNKLRSFNNGSHEIFIGFDFVSRKNKNISPRYL